MNTPVIFDDAVAGVAYWLRTEMSDTTVIGQLVETRPAEFVLVRRAGGQQATVTTERPLIIVESWAATDVAAHDLGQTCRAHCQRLRGQTVDGIQFYRVAEVGGFVPLPDPASDQYRYTFLIEAHVRGATFEP